MKTAIIQITATKKPPYRMKIGIRSSWLADMGFAYGIPVWAAPLPDGFTLALQCEHNEKNNGGGKLLHVGLDGAKPALTLNFAKNFTIAGLAAGDFLAAQYEHGIITAKKLPPAQRYYVVTSQNHSAFLRLCGVWLNDTGFLPGTIAMADTQRDCITLRLWDEPAEPAASYCEIVKFARTHQYQILQTQKNQHITVLDLDGYMLNRAGFDTGGIAGVHYEHGRITLFKPDLQKLGF